ncbi:MAG: hypothetical protein OEV34_02825, partial [Gammaproteobacteria bacterium]|nr:hypothetical protein [Gammaproteobacteria bacterium]
MNPRILFPAVALAISACSQPQEPAVDGADAVYTNAMIYMVDAGSSWADAMAVTDGKIVAIGTAADMAAHTDDGTAVHDLKGRMVMPGIHDTHNHPSDAGVGKTIECSFLEVTLDSAIAAMQECLQGIPEGEWLRGGQWNDGLFVGTDKMPKEILD